MNISVLSIGDEILSGDTVNTNSTWICQKITELGFDVVRQVTCQDNKKEIISSISFLLESSPNYVIVTGGLGPTEDDITRKVLFDYFDVQEIFDEKYWQKLVLKYKKLDIEVLDSNRSQAIIPSDGGFLPNPIGSARGYSFIKKNTKFFILPGVPSEMKGIMNETILVELQKIVTKPILRKLIRTTGYPESVLAHKIKKITDLNHGCKIGYYPSAYGVDIRISNTSSVLLEKFFIGIQNILGDICFSGRKISIEHLIIKKLSLLNKTVSIAESCTGGLLGHRITNIPMASKVFNGGLITYSNESKSRLLGIPKKLIDDHGAVSEIVARKMSEEVKKRFETDYGISITGIAGPGGGTKEKPVGTVFIGISGINSTKVYKYMFGKDREKNKLKTSQAAFNMLRLSI